MIYLTEDDVRRRLTMPDAVRLVEEAFRQRAAGQADNVPRARCQAPGFVLHSMSAAAAYLGLAGWKCYSTTKAGAKFHVGLYDVASGTLRALIEADRLGQIRTGATTAVAVKHLSPADADRLGLFGTGWQAQAQLAAVAAVRPLREVVVFSRQPERRAKFVEQMSSQFPFRLIAAAQPRQAAENLPLVVTATSSRTPVLQGEWLAPGTLLAAMGSNWLEKTELDVAAVARAARVVCDDIACCQREAGDFVAALEQGVFSWDQAENLADVVAGLPQPARTESQQRSDNAGDITLFKSVGMAMEDVAVAAWVAQEELRQAGVELPRLD